MPPVRIVALISLVALTGACGAFLPHDELPSIPYDELPITTPELRKVADRVYRTTRRHRDLVRARTALRKAQFLEPGKFGTEWRLARVDALLARLDVDRTSQWAREGLEAAEQARTKRPDRVEGHIYYAMCAGFLAKARPTEAEHLMNAIVEASEKAIAADPDFEDGEASRVLGAIYLYAPSWPSGVGDLDAAFDTLRPLVEKHPKDPRNLFYLAEAHRRADERTEALALYRGVLTAPKRGIWGLEGRSYRAEASAHIRALAGD